MHDRVQELEQEPHPNAASEGGNLLGGRGRSNETTEEKRARRLKEFDAIDFDDWDAADYKAVLTRAVRAFKTKYSSRMIKALMGDITVSIGEYGFNRIMGVHCPFRHSDA